MARSSNKLVSVINAGKRYDSDGKTVETAAVEDINLDLTEGDMVSIVGQSGCGKTTLLLMMAGLEQATSGKVLFEGEQLKRPNRKIGLVLQDYGLFPWKTVKQNVELGLKIRKEKIDSSGAHSLLEELGIGEKLNLYPQQLSGGQKQRVALARALILGPKLLLLDEPFAALDTLTRERLQDLTAEICGRRNISTVLVTHNIPEAVRLGRRILIMGGKPGRISSTFNNAEAGQSGIRDGEQFNFLSRQIRQELAGLNEKI